MNKLVNCKMKVFKVAPAINCETNVLSMHLISKVTVEYVERDVTNAMRKIKPIFCIVLIAIGD